MLFFAFFFNLNRKTQPGLVTVSRICFSFYLSRQYVNTLIKKSPAAFYRVSTWMGDRKKVRVKVFTFLNNALAYVLQHVRTNHVCDFRLISSKKCYSCFQRIRCVVRLSVSTWLFFCTCRFSLCFSCLTSVSRSWPVQRKTVCISCAPVKKKNDKFYEKSVVNLVISGYELRYNSNLEFARAKEGSG